MDGVEPLERAGAVMSVVTFSSERMKPAAVSVDRQVARTGPMCLGKGHGRPYQSWWHGA